MKPTMATMTATSMAIHKGVPLPRRPFPPSDKAPACRAANDDDAGENQKRHAVADTALGDLLAQPHDEAVPVVSVSTVMMMKPLPGLMTKS